PPKPLALCRGHPHRRGRYHRMGAVDRLYDCFRAARSQLVAERIRYKKLPGHRRGFIRGASLWLGPDHVLAVNSLRFREEYKRYYFRDIQALVVARSPRFHLSTRAAVLGFFWLIAFASFYQLPYGALVVGILGVLLVASWVYFSAVCSCTCRI